MENTDRGAAVGRAALPLAQTVFLPKTAMGVKYIENIRTNVYAENVEMQQGTRCLRGFYELDIEYRGLEGRGLYKHRVMLPLRAELPGDWLPGMRCEVSDIHAAISRPAVRILSPYVLEFSGRLRLEYIGNMGAKPGALPPVSTPRPKSVERHWSSDIPPVLQDEAAKRLESKIDSMFFRRAGDAEAADRTNAADIADKPAMPPVRAAEAAEERSEADESGFRLPVWRRGMRPTQSRESQRRDGRGIVSAVWRNSVMRNDAVQDDMMRHNAMQDDMMRNDVVRNDAVQDDIMRNDIMRNDMMQNDMMQNDVVRNGMVRNDVMQDNMMRNDTVRHNAVQDDMMRNETVQDDMPQDEIVQNTMLSGRRNELGRKIERVFSRLQSRDIGDIFRQEIISQVRPQQPGDITARENIPESAGMENAGINDADMYHSGMYDTDMYNADRHNADMEDTGAEDTESAAGYHLPVWKRRGDAGQMASPGGVAALRDKILGRMEQNNAYAAAGVFKTQRIAERPRAAEQLPEWEPDKGRVRAMLTAAAISRLRSQGEKLVAADAAAAAGYQADTVNERIEAGQQREQEKAARAAAPQVVWNSPKEVTADIAAAVVEQKPHKPAEQAAEAAPAPAAVRHSDEMAENTGRLAEAAAAADVPKVIIVDAAAEAVAGQDGDAEQTVLSDAVNERQTAHHSESEYFGEDHHSHDHYNEADHHNEIDYHNETDHHDEAEHNAAEEVRESEMREAKSEDINTEASEIADDLVREVAADDGNTAESADIEAAVSADDSRMPEEAPVVVQDNEAATVNEAVVNEAAAAGAAAAEPAAGAVEDEAADSVAVAGAGVTQNSADRVRLINTNGVRLRMNSGVRQSMPLPAVGAKGGGRALKYYVVKPGDDPMSIALKHNVSLESLQAHNKLTDGELTAGMVLRIPC